jgi:hypothetical protein
MQLHTLTTIASGLESLAQLEQEHPVIGAKFSAFVAEVQSCCSEAYGRLSRVLGAIRKLPDKPDEREIRKLVAQIEKLPDSNWFKNVSEICNRLRTVAASFNSQISEQVRYARSKAPPQSNPSADEYRLPDVRNLSALIWTLSSHEGEMKEDMRAAVWNLESAIGKAKSNGDFSSLKALAREAQHEIDIQIDQISNISNSLRANSSKGVQELLDVDIARNALQKPELVLILSMCFLALIFAGGAYFIYSLMWYQFVLIAAFALTAVVVVNAFYLRTVDKLSERGFLSLMRLALLNFFAPLAKKAKP